MKYEYKTVGGLVKGKEFSKECELLSRDGWEECSGIQVLVVASSIKAYKQFRRPIDQPKEDFENMLNEKKVWHDETEFPAHLRSVIAVSKDEAKRVYYDNEVGWRNSPKGKFQWAYPPK